MSHVSAGAAGSNFQDSSLTGLVKQRRPSVEGPMDLSTELLRSPQSTLHPRETKWKPTCFQYLVSEVTRHQFHHIPVVTEFSPVWCRRKPHYSHEQEEVRISGGRPGGLAHKQPSGLHLPSKWMSRDQENITVIILPLSVKWLWKYDSTMEWRGTWYRQHG